MNLNGYFGPSPPPVLPRAADILGPPQYPKGFEKRQRDQGVDSALGNGALGNGALGNNTLGNNTLGNNTLGNNTLGNNTLGNSIDLGSNDLADLGEYPNPALYDFGEAPSRPSPYARLDFEPSPIPSTFLSNSPLPSELFKSPGSDFNPLALPHIPTPHNQNLYKGTRDSDSKDSDSRDVDFKESNSDSNSDQKDDSNDYRATSKTGESNFRNNAEPIGDFNSDFANSNSDMNPEFNPEFISSDAQELARKDPPKVAPRSSTLYRIGPPFSGTTTVRPFFCSDTHEQMVPEIQARFDRGFEMGDAGNWIGYKRNYFTLVSAFSFRGWDLHRFARGRFHLQSSIVKASPESTGPESGMGNGGSGMGNGGSGMGNKRSGTEEADLKDKEFPENIPIRYFALGISVQCNDPEVDIGLVQHTPKRDKGPKLPTPIYPTVPGGKLPDHHTVRLSCNKKNGDKVQMVSKWFEMDGDAYMQAHDLSPTQTILSAYPSMPAKVARFERIQFTASLRVRPASHPSRSPKHFILSVHLLAYIDSESSSDFQESKDFQESQELKSKDFQEFESKDFQGSVKLRSVEPVVVAKVFSAPLLVRGRSPSKYPTERTSGFRSSIQN